MQSDPAPEAPPRRGPKGPAAIRTVHERTDPEAREAVARYAAVCRKPAAWWAAVQDTADVRHLAVDFFDPATGRYGQALGSWAEGGPWRQAPLGERPVLLFYLRGGERRVRLVRAPRAPGGRA